MGAIKIKFRIKDKNIRVFTEKPSPEGLIKQYQHPQGTTLKAYVRSLSGSEQFGNQGVQSGASIEVVIGYRPITKDMIIEYAGESYGITGQDGFEHYKTDLKFWCQLLPPKDYVAEEYGEWLK